jgi:hypothetical protein
MAGLGDGQRHREQEKQHEYAERRGQDQRDAGPPREPAAVEPANRRVETDREEQGQPDEDQDLPDRDDHVRQCKRGRHAQRPDETDEEWRLAVKRAAGAPEPVLRGRAGLGRGVGVNVVNDVLGRRAGLIRLKRAVTRWFSAHLRASNHGCRPRMQPPRRRSPPRSVPGPVDVGLELFQAEPHPALDRSGRQAELRRDLGVRQLTEVGEDDYLLLGVGKHGQ